MLPHTNPRNVHIFLVLLYPIIEIMKDRDQKRMQIIFEKYVITNYDEYYRNEGAKTPCAPMFDPLTLLPGISEDEEIFSMDQDLENYISWAAEEEGGVCSEFLDSIMSDYGCPPYNDCENVLPSFEIRERKKLIAKSRLLTSRVNQKLICGEDRVVLHAAFAENERARQLAMKAGRVSFIVYNTIFFLDMFFLTMNHPSFYSKQRNAQ